MELGYNQTFRVHSYIAQSYDWQHPLGCKAKLQPLMGACSWEGGLGLWDNRSSIAEGRSCIILHFRLDKSVGHDQKLRWSHVQHEINICDC